MPEINFHEDIDFWYFKGGINQNSVMSFLDHPISISESLTIAHCAVWQAMPGYGCFCSRNLSSDFRAMQCCSSLVIAVTVTDRGEQRRYCPKVTPIQVHVGLYPLSTRERVLSRH